PHPADQTPNFVFLVWIQPVRWFIQYQHIRIMDDRLGKTGAVTITFGECVYALIKNRFKKAHFNGAMNRFLPVISAQTTQFRAETQKTPDGHIYIDWRAFRKVAYQSL